MMKKHREKNILENKIYNLIRDDDINSWQADLVDGALIFLIFISVVVAFLNTFQFTDAYQTTIYVLELIFVVLFSIEYILRVWTSELMRPDELPMKARIKYMMTPMALIDLFSILPFYLAFFGFSTTSLEALRLVRLLRVFKINRYTSSLSLIGSVLKSRVAQLLSSISVIMVLMFISAMLMYDIEHIAQPEVFDNALSSLWWAMATITTVGYGDIYPVTTAGRILSTFITFLGIFLTAIPTGIISAGFIEESSKRRSLKDHEQ